MQGNLNEFIFFFPLLYRSSFTINLRTTIIFEVTMCCNKLCFTGGLTVRFFFFFFILSVSLESTVVISFVNGENKEYSLGKFTYQDKEIQLRVDCVCNTG